MDHGGSHATANAHGMAGLDELGGAAQGPRDVGDGLARTQLAEVHGRLADRLDDERDGPRGRVRVRDGERDPLGTRAAAHDDELAGLTDLCDARREHDQPRHVGRELLPVDDGVHVAPRHVCGRSIAAVTIVVRPR